MFSESKVKQQNKIVFSKYNLRDKKVFWKRVSIYPTKKNTYRSAEYFVLHVDTMICQRSCYASLLPLV